MDSQLQKGLLPELGLVVGKELIVQGFVQSMLCHGTPKLARWGRGIPETLCVPKDGYASSQTQ